MKAGTGTVSVTAPARLHFGFLDLNGSSGRRFGSLGLTLDGIGVHLSAARAPAGGIAGPQAARAERFVHALRERYELQGECRIAIHEAIPEHVGMGSGTQLAIAIGVALSRLYGLDLPIREIAALHERGQRSGVGIGSFQEGGFLVDGGRGVRDEPPPLVARVDFPAPWRVLLILDRGIQGLHGEAEVAAFRALPAFPAASSAQLCRLVLMQALPALIECDLAAFGAAIGEIQRVTGDYFAPAQGGRFTSARVAEVLAWLESQGIAGVGQSSWGPTGFAIVESEARAQALAREARARWCAADAPEFRVCAGRNRGGDVSLADAARRSAATPA